MKRLLVSALLLAMSTGAWGQDTGVLGPFPAGTVLVSPTMDEVTPVGEFWVLPTPFYDRALVAAKQRQVCVEHLDFCTEEGLRIREQSVATLKFSKAALDMALTQFDTDEGTTGALTAKLLETEVQLDDTQDRLQRMRGQRNTALAVSGTAVLTMVLVYAVTR
jgi:hypothetical protein